MVPSSWPFNVSHRTGQRLDVSFCVISHIICANHIRHVSDVADLVSNNNTFSPGPLVFHCCYGNIHFSSLVRLFNQLSQLLYRTSITINNHQHHNLPSTLHPSTSTPLPNSHAPKPQKKTMCKYPYTQFTCSCRYFFYSPQYCAAALARSSSPPEPWIHLVSTADPAYKDFNIETTYNGDFRFQAYKFFEPALKCENVELVRRGEEDHWCSFHTSAHIPDVVWKEYDSMKTEEKRKERERKEKSVRTWMKRAVKKMLRDSFFAA